MRTLLRSYLSLLILVPKELSPSPKELGEMVREINRTQVEREERLSDRVYEYDKERGSICQVQDSLERKREIER